MTFDDSARDRGQGARNFDDRYGRERGYGGEGPWGRDYGNWGYGGREQWGGAGNQGGRIPPYRESYAGGGYNPNGNWGAERQEGRGYGMEGRPTNAGYGGFGPEGDYGMAGQPRDDRVSGPVHYGGPRYGAGYGTGASREDTRWGGDDQYRAGEQPARANHAGRGPKGYRRSDERIQEDVNEALTRDPDVDASEIEVRVQNGEVTLTGTVDERRAKRRAEDVAESCSGVTDVHNQLRVVAGGAHGRDQAQGAQTSDREVDRTAGQASGAADRVPSETRRGETGGSQSGATSTK